MSARGGDQRGDQVSGSRAPPLRTFEKLIQMFLRISLENFSRKIKKILLLSLSSSLREKKERKKERKKKERKKERNRFNSKPRKPNVIYRNSFFGSEFEI